MSCGTPGDPAPPRPAVPAAIQDLGARQSGDSVVLTFTLPVRTVEGEPLATPPQVEIYRGDEAPAPGGEFRATLLYTVPAALVDTYLAGGKATFSDPLLPEFLAREPGRRLLYAVKTRASRRKDSAFSNVVALRVFPVPERIRDLRARASEAGVELEWTPPERTTGGAPIPSLAGYRVYRAAVESADAAAPQRLPGMSPPELLGVTGSAAYRDTQCEFGRAYLYTVRSVAQFEADSVESESSLPVQITLRDIFAPAAPLNLVAVPVPATAETPAQMELSWSLSPEADVAGYYLYRSEAEDTAWARVNRELLQVPAFRDTSVLPGRRYTYAVTAVDRAGNESPRSAPASAEVPISGGNGKPER